MERWDIALFVIAAVVAVGTLVRLMRRRRDQLVADIQQQFEEHRRRQAEFEEERKNREREGAA
ncbi:hypothetical protein NG895_17715 [Aeoliella sp. ICT_H6.2]|uniref:Uncharacterized protein n=1 Tax=Aeoliella straminimaris TaxID=2954799 RepID=A0A9X2FCM2_9BACT|nr:hypothetical protein [Aeoliella straminimaris]MCO6045738.1 hypothetical protein [Aeoliella straminimaris]